MTRRPPDEQQLHDRVISAIFKRLTKAGRIAETNPGKLRMVEISGYYPDVLAVLVHERTDIVQAVYEVETWSSIEETHARHQWSAFATLGVIFFLVVPQDTLDEARRVVLDLDIDAKLVGYREADDGAIIFDGEIIPPL